MGDRPVSRPSPWPRADGDLTFRRPVEADVGPVLQWRNDPRVTYWLLRTVADEASLRAAVAEPEEGDHSVVVEQDGTVVAMGYLSVLDGMGQSHGDTHRGSRGLIGWTVAPAVWGRGVGTRVAGMLLRAAFEDLGLHRVTAGCFADNTASWRIMERLGMRREQHGVQDSWHAELGWVDGYTYAMLRSEWTAASPDDDAPPGGTLLG